MSDRDDDAPGRPLIGGGSQSAVDGVEELAQGGRAGLWGQHADYTTTIVGQMILMGAGLGLISTPATESIMQVLPPRPRRCRVSSAARSVSPWSAPSSPRCTPRAAARESVGVADAIGAQVAGRPG